MVPWIDSCVRCMALFLTCFFFDNGTAAMSCQFILPRHQLCLVVPILSLRSLPHDSACKSGATCRERASSSKLLAECLPPQCCLPPLGPPPPCAPAHRLGMVAAATGVGDRVCGGDSARGCWRPTGAAAFAWCLTDLAGTGRWKAILGCGSRRLVGTAAFARSLTATARLEAMVACAGRRGSCIMGDAARWPPAEEDQRLRSSCTAARAERWDATLAVHRRWRRAWRRLWSLAALLAGWGMHCRRREGSSWQQVPAGTAVGRTMVLARAQVARWPRASKEPPLRGGAAQRPRWPPWHCAPGGPPTRALPEVRQLSVRGTSAYGSATAPSAPGSTLKFWPVWSYLAAPTQA